MTRMCWLTLAITFACACDHDDYSFREGSDAEGSAIEQCVEGSYACAGEERYHRCENGEWSETRECPCSEYYGGGGCGVVGENLESLVCMGGPPSWEVLGPCPPEDTGR